MHAAVPSSAELPCRVFRDNEFFFASRAMINELLIKRKGTTFWLNMNLKANCTCLHGRFYNQLKYLLECYREYYYYFLIAFVLSSLKIQNNIFVHLKTRLHAVKVRREQSSDWYRPSGPLPNEPRIFSSLSLNPRVSLLRPDRTRTRQTFFQLISLREMFDETW